MYRKLIHDMLTAGVPMPDDRTRHVVAELINSIFDVDKMLYFVAPEWWRPRLRSHTQQLGPTTKPPISGATATAATMGLSKKVFGATVGGSTASPLTAHTVGWGGVDGIRPGQLLHHPTPSRPGSAPRSAGCCSSTATTCATPSSTRRG